MAKFKSFQAQVSESFLQFPFAEKLNLILSRQKFVAIMDRSMQVSLLTIKFTQLISLVLKQGQPFIELILLKQLILDIATSHREKKVASKL